MKMPGGLDVLQSYFVNQPKPIAGLKTIQLYLYREILDYTVLRTEDDRELNMIATPATVNSEEAKTRVAFLGSKQKAVESRQLERMLRTATEEEGFDAEECFLKDHLCLACPRCGLFGGTTASSGKKFKVNANIKHRISYSTAFSLGTVEDLREAVTFNGISDKLQTTGQTLGERVAVRPGNLFPSIVTLTGVTWMEFVLVVKTLLSAHKYGAESRIGGDVRNHIVGIAGGWEEVMTPLEFTLELDSASDFEPAQVPSIIEKYVEGTANPEKVRVLSAEDIKQVVDSARLIPIDKPFLEVTYQQVKSFRADQGE